MKKFGLIGKRLDYSLSKVIHEMLFDKLDIDAIYDLIELSPKEVNRFMTNELHTYNGINVTIPYKEKVFDYLDEMDSLSKSINAVNTILNKNNISGYNTDYFGIKDTIIKYNIPMDKDVYILGSGGASKGAFKCFSDMSGGKIWIVSRDKSNCQYFPKENVCNYNEMDLSKPFVLVNTTPVGMTSLIEKSPVEKNILANCVFIFDMIYKPAKTKLLKYAENLKINNCNGLFMLVSQAIKADEIWLDMHIDSNITMEIYESVRRMI